MKCLKCQSEKDLVLAKEGPPYCKECFSGKLSMMEKRAFVPKYKKDLPMIKKSIKRHADLIGALMGSMVVYPQKTNRQWAKEFL